MAEPFPELIIRNSAELADALAAGKNFRGLSNESLEALCLFARGHVDKMLGPSREKNIGARSLDYLLAALALRLRIEPDPEQERRMRSRWEGRNSKQVRQCQPVSKAMLEKCRPIILAKLAWQSGTGYRG